MLVIVCLVPLTVMIVYLLFMVNRFSGRYDTIADNITQANEYSIHFKEEMDYTMYMIVANVERAEELLGTERPHVLIEKAREDFQRLYRSGSEYTRSQLKGILKCLDTLEDRVEEIEADALSGGAYDENMERLDLNIRVLTELIQERIQEYISLETNRLEKLREGIRSDVSKALRSSIFVFTAILLGAVTISRQIVTGISEPIRRLSEAAKQAASGDFAVRAQEDSDDELTVLNVSFNRMVEKIGQMVDDIKIEQLNLRQAELKLLQAQINPHFLYNTLDSIIWLAEAGEKEKVVQMVSSLSDFFRTTLNKGKDYITLQEEETHIRSYLQIQQQRYQDILEYEIRIPQELCQYPILKLTLQPLVENALYHGIKNKRGVGHIWVDGRREGENLIFCVRDDGIGMKPQQLDEVRKLIAGEQPEENQSSGFGLFNVNQRLRLNYGAEYGVKIHSTYREGTVVEASIPIEEHKIFN